jgi:1-acyl-sn-glycerol-3-phosphate acyltransferase
VEEWKLEPAHDLAKSPLDRPLSVRREAGLVGSAARLVFWSGVRLALHLVHRLEVRGREHLPAGPPFVMAANHASHLDALVLGAALPLAWRDHVFPLAAGDLFFRNRGRAVLAAGLLNALPVWRRRPGASGVRELRQRLLAAPCVYLLFPEGTRTRDGRMGPFKPGVGMLTAGTPVPVVPCHLGGTFEAFPPHRVLSRRHKIVLRIGEPLDFSGVPPDHAGWTSVARAVEAAVKQVASSQ